MGGVSRADQSAQVLASLALHQCNSTVLHLRKLVWYGMCSLFPAELREAEAGGPATIIQGHSTKRGVAMFGRTDSRTLIDRGRKAGLGTAEMYRALAARRP